MQNFLYKIQRFMYGRNGIDGLGIFLIIISFILRSISTFSRNYLLYITSLIILIYMIYRVFSRNVYIRQKENRYFMKYFNKIHYYFKNSAELSKERAKFRPTHKIYVCPKCKKHLKVPKGKGKIEILCPCSYRFIKRT